MRTGHFQEETSPQGIPFFESCPPYGRVRNPMLRSIPGRKKCDTRLAGALRDRYRCIVRIPTSPSPIEFLATNSVCVHIALEDRPFPGMPKELRADADVADPRLMVSPSSNHAPLWSGTQPHLAVHTWEKKVRHPSRAGSSRPMHHVSPPPLTPPFQCRGAIHRYVSECRGATASL